MANTFSLLNKLSFFFTKPKLDKEGEIYHQFHLLYQYRTYGSESSNYRSVSDREYINKLKNLDLKLERKRLETELAALDASTAN